MMEQDISKFNPQNFVETQSKKIAQSDRLHALFKFIKFNYMLPGYELKTTTKSNMINTIVIIKIQLPHISSSFDSFRIVIKITNKQPLTLSLSYIYTSK